MEGIAVKINYSIHSEYHSQRNNAIVPFSSCNTTSMVMALKQARWGMPADSLHEQPEDSLSAFLRTRAAYEKQKELAAWSVGAYPPQEVHACLRWGVNAWIGKEVDRFSLAVRAPELVAALDSGGGAVLSGRFPMPSGDLGHIVSLAGYVVDDASGELIRWIIDDPYGDWHSQYRVHRGNDIDLTVDQFRQIFDRRRDGNYWAHIIRPA